MGFFDLFKQVTFSGGDGTSESNAVIVHTKSSLKGIPAEYSYIESKYGKRGLDWQLVEQTSLNSKSGKSLDLLTISLINGQKVSVYFDISEFH